MREDNMSDDGLIAVGDLLESSFFVPAYQRGYRWTNTQVERLIEDIEEFKKEVAENSSDFYCLQPLVTVERVVDGECYKEVIDGQQRLTTILLILQAIHSLIRVKNQDDSDKFFDITYETRGESADWLNKIKYIRSKDDDAAQDLMGRNCDYYHLVEVYCRAYELLKGKSDEELREFRNFLYRRVKFIPYTPTKTSDSNNDIFDDINAGRLKLNNAELIKALLVQDSNLKGRENEEYRLNRIALEWDAVERTLHDKEFWGFIYSSNHPFAYDTNIEYLFDLKYNKQKGDADNECFTFDEVNKVFRAAEDKLEIAEVIWREVKEIFDKLVEWYNSRPLYHRIGYLLEYGKGDTVSSLIALLKGKKKDEQIAVLDKRIRDSLNEIAPRDLFHGNYKLSQVLFLYNALAEDKRVGTTARFSFACYKNVKKKGWDQEHIASATDAKAKKGEHKKFAREMIEFFTGKLFLEDEEIKLGKELDSLNEEERVFVERLTAAGNCSGEYPEEDLRALFNDILVYFKTNEDGFKDEVIKKDKGQTEKDFIWNFVLLNAGTNRSYGNSLFPVKRKRILNDEFEVYTPVGTRNVFEKAYSRKLTNMMSWTREDAKAYWSELCKVLSPYITLELPQGID